MWLCFERLIPLLWLIPTLFGICPSCGGFMLMYFGPSNLVTLFNEIDHSKQLMYVKMRSSAK